ncbi:class I SAM-dependent methyltransferase [Patescibacteria group bacterium]|nr:class I SAM-dependent methyltransferase [Patescibacteria group bacterium]
MQDIKIKKLTKCRVCKSSVLIKVITLGPTPLANAFLKKDQVDGPEDFFPLDVYFCKNCTMLELGHVVSPVLLFSDYVYVSSTSPVFAKHFKDFATDICRRFKLGSNSLVIDIGSNDGILLKPFREFGARTLGIEPAKKIAKVARKDGIETIDDFFSISLAKKIVKEKGKAAIVTATNVFAHIDNLDEVIQGLKILLSQDGVFIIEAPYLIDMLEKKYFDLVYHEHLSYWAVLPLMTLFKRFDMEIFDVEKVDAHGGSIRIFVKKKEGKFKKSDRVDIFLKMEKKAKISNISTYLNYVNEILENRKLLISLLSNLKLKGARIAAYGAPAKGNTLLNFFSIGSEILDYIVDDSVWKQGLYSPGKRIPIVSSKFLYKDKPDYLLILAWNFASSIMKNHEKFKKTGGRFIIPVPVPKII